MENSFDPIAYLNGLTRFVFEDDALENIAYENGLVELTDRSQIDEYTKDHCLIALYELVINGPWSVAMKGLTALAKSPLRERLSFLKPNATYSRQQS